MATRADLRIECEERIQDQTNVIATDAQVNLWINRAVREIAREAAWPFLRKRATLSFSAGTPTADLPDDCRTVIKAMRVISDGGRETLIGRPDRWIQDNTSPASRGTPYFYTDGGFKQVSATSPIVRTLRIAPTPESATDVEISYIRRGDNLASDNAYPPFPEEFDECIVLWVMRQYWRQIEADSAVAEHDKAYKEELQKLKNFYLPETTERYPIILSDYSYDPW